MEESGDKLDKAAPDNQTLVCSTRERSIAGGNLHQSQRADGLRIISCFSTSPQEVGDVQNLQLRNEKVEPKRFSCVSDALKHVRLVQVFNEPAAYYEGVRCILGNGGPSGFLLGGSLR